MCAIETLHKPDDTKSYVEGVIPIAGEFSNGRHLDPYWTRLSTSSHPGDHDREGLRLKMGGGYFADRKQEAVIEFLCSKEVDKMTLRRRTHPELLPRREKDEEEDDEDDEDDDEDDKDKDKDEDEEPDLPHDGESTSDGAGGILKFTSYDLVGESKVLNLEWQTPHACEDSAKDGSGKGGGGKDGKSEGGGHWGFFTWLIIMFVFFLPSDLPKPILQFPFPPSKVSPTSLPTYSPPSPSAAIIFILTPFLTNSFQKPNNSVFLLTAAYLIFGSWLNYNRYSARGWDLLPHSETLRDLPYLFREWGRKAVDTVQGRGGGSRGGYSAV